jgi:putative hydrolase of the HAD superfamily
MRIESVWDGIEGIVFDAVGTLIDPDPPVAEVYAAAARRQGVELEPGLVRSRFYRSFQSDEVDEVRGPLATDELNELRRWRRIVAGALPELPDPERAFAELWEHFSRPGSWTLFPDVAPALEAIGAAGLPVRIGSNFDARLRSVVAGLPELAQVVGPLIISSEVGYRKPHPAFFEAVRASFGLPAERIVCIGDDLDNDVRGALGSGLRGVLLDRKGKHSGANIPRIASLSALRSALGGSGTTR